jgi:hypothetical protein
MSARRGPLLVGAYALVLGVSLALLAPRATLCVDGNMYLEMARQIWERGSFEVPNGLEVVDSAELWIPQTVRREGRLWAKYPPLYAMVAAPVFGAAGLRGLVALNAASLGLLVLAFYFLARDPLGERWAVAGTLALPWCTPLLGYGVVVMPHLLAACSLLWAILLLERGRALGPGAQRRIVLLGLAAGLLGGLSAGTRLQNLLPVAVAVVVLGAAARRPSLLVTGALTGLLASLVTIAWANQARFGSPNPLSYGPAGELGSPVAYETPAYFLTAAPLAAAAVLLVAVAWRARPGRRRLIWGAATLALVVVVAFPASRQALHQLLAGLYGLLLDSSILTPDRTPPTWLGWLQKSLLQSSPVLVLGLGAAFGLRRLPPLIATLAWSSLLVVLFIGLRHGDPYNPTTVLGIAGFNARYLLDICPALLLLALYAVRQTRPGWGALLAFLAAAVAATMLLWRLGPDGGALKHHVLELGPLGLALLAALALPVPRAWRARALLALVVLAGGYGAALNVTQDLRATVTVTGLHQRWLERLEAVLPRRLALVGWDGGMHGVVPLRARRQVILVDTAIDDGADLIRVLRALERRGLPRYYFGIGLERIAPRLRGHFIARVVLRDPLLLRLDREGPAATASGAGQRRSR